MGIGSAVEPPTATAKPQPRPRDSVRAVVIFFPCGSTDAHPW